MANLLSHFVARKNYKAADKYLERALALAERPGPNLETLSYFQSWDGDLEIEITLEILGNALEIKIGLRDKKGTRDIAQRILDYCQKYAPDSELLERAKGFVK